MTGEDFVRDDPRFRRPGRHDSVLHTRVPSFDDTAIPLLTPSVECRVAGTRLIPACRCPATVRKHGAIPVPIAYVATHAQRRRSARNQRRNEFRGKDKKQQIERPARVVGNSVARRDLLTQGDRRADGRAGQSQGGAYAARARSAAVRQGVRRRCGFRPPTIPLSVHFRCDPRSTRVRSSWPRR